MNAWDEVELTRQVRGCLNRGLVCGVVSNKRDDLVRPMPTGPDPPVRDTATGPVTAGPERAVSTSR